MGWVYGRGEERDDWLEQQRASYERVIAGTATRLSPHSACSPTKDGSCSPTGRCSSRASNREDQPTRTAPRGHHLCPATRLPHHRWTATRPACTGGSPARRPAHRGPGLGGYLPRRPGMPPRCAGRATGRLPPRRSEEHTSELQSPYDLVCRLLLEKKKKKHKEDILYIKKQTQHKKIK